MNRKNTGYSNKTTATSQLQNPLTGHMNVGEYYPKSKVSDLSSPSIGIKISIEISSQLEKWQSLLDIHHWAITCEPIDEMQVVDALEGDTPGHEFVGISIDFTNKTGIIHHTRPLQEDDIIHELLHVRFPDWSEQKVDYWTNLLVNQQDVDIKRDDV